MTSFLRFIGAFLLFSFSALNATSQAGAALQFDGVNDYVVSDNNIGITGNQPRTVEYWAKLVSTYAHHVNWGQTNNSDRVFGTYTSAGQLLFYAWGSSDFVTGFVPDGNAHRVAVTYDGAFVRVYVDGMLTPAGAVRRNINTVDGKVYVGCREDISVFSSNTIDEVRIWNRVLCYSEIQNDLNCELPPSQNGLKLYYKFNHGTASANNAGITTVVDQSGNNNNGSLVNFALSGTTSNWVFPGAVPSGVSCGAFVTAEIGITANSNIVYDGITEVSAATNTDFGNVDANSTSTKNFLIQNSGNTNLNIASITFTGAAAADFTASGITLPAVVAPGGSLSFSVVFSPSANGTRNAVIHINNNDCDEGDYDFPLKAIASEVFTSSTGSTSFCQGAPVVITYATNYTYNSGNTFTAQLSNASGSFASPVNIGSVASTISGNIVAAIPNGTAAGTAYRIRIISSDPVYIGVDNGANISVSAPVNSGTKDFTGSGNWNNASNWNPCGVPNTNDNVIIGTSDSVMVPAGFNAAAKSVVMFDGGKLYVAATGKLAVNGAVGDGDNGNGIFIYGAATKLDNAGTINIANTTSVNLRGIYVLNNGTLINQATGIVTIDSVIVYNGIQADGGTIINNGTINIGTTTGMGDHGIYLGSVNLTNNGLLQINRAKNYAIVAASTSVTITNTGSIKIGTIPSVTKLGIFNGGNFTNATFGAIEIDAIVSADGLYNSGSFANSGSLKIGGQYPVYRFGILNIGSLVNNLGALIEVDRISAYDGINNNISTATIINSGSIKVGSKAAIAYNGFTLVGPITNNASGTITIDRVGVQGIECQQQLTNQGSITIGNVGAINVSGINLSSTGVVANSGTIEINNIPNVASGGSAITSVGSVSNTGILNIGKTTLVKNGLNGNGTFTNTGTITMGNKIALDGISIGTTINNNSGGTLQTSDNGVLKIAGTLDNKNGASVVNAATGTITINGTLIDNGNFTNNGTTINNGKLTGAGTITQSGTFTNTAAAHIAPGNSPGTLTVNGNFNLGASTLDIEVVGKNPGQYDVLAINGTATTASATLAVTLDPVYTPYIGHTLPFLVSTGTITGGIGGTAPSGFLIANNFPAQGSISLYYGLILPIKLLSFTAQRTNYVSNRIEWKTATETNGIQYQVERSMDGRQFVSIGQVAAYGRPSVYTFLDNQPLQPINYYRLKIKEPTGETSYSQVVALASQPRSAITISPIPATNTIVVINSAMAWNGRPVTIIDMQGKLMYHFGLEASHRINIANWACGVYYLSLPDGTSMPIVKQ